MKFYAVSICAMKEDKDMVKTSHACFIAQVNNEDEAIGLGYRVLDRHYPASHWPMARSVALSRPLEVPNAIAVSSSIKYDDIEERAEVRNTLLGLSEEHC